MTDRHEPASAERCVVNADHPMLAGHFPGHPIVPGAWLLAWVVSTATRRLAAQGQTYSIAAIKRVKFLRPLAPECAFECAFNATGTNNPMRFVVTSGGAVIAEGSFQMHQLVN
ncbi:MAG TPA: hypothetical protein VM937_06605 [Burkholderiaceae bacterium]|nr:hypothetical protein [Burkholderiaceae bacterium]